VVWTPDGKNIASGSDDETIKVWYTQTGQCVSTLRGDKKINCVAFSPDGKILATGDGDMCMFDKACSVRLYDTVTGDVKSTLTGHRYTCFYVLVLIISRTGVLF
jgi:WD40 repeat protein